VAIRAHEPFYALLHLELLSRGQGRRTRRVGEIENGYPTSWNGTYYWNARFRVRLDSLNSGST
jgi:hypothetical protein